MNKPKIILWDTEISTAVVKGYGNKWDFKYVKEIMPQKLMSYAYKELDEEEVHFVHMHEFDTQKELVQSLSDVLSSADVTVAHNGINFDDKMANTFFITNGVDRPSPRKSVDTLRVARSAFRFPSNSLKDLASYLGLDAKMDVGYMELEDGFLLADAESIGQMAEYNKQDVTVLEQLYKIMLPYINNHPNMGVYMREEGVCPHCGDKDHLQSRGEGYRVTGSVKQYFCTSCKSWSYDRVATPEVKPTLVSGR